MKFAVIIILALIAIIALVVVMMTLEEDAIYKEGLNDKHNHRDIQQRKDR